MQPRKPPRFEPEDVRLRSAVDSFKNLLIWHVNIPTSRLHDGYHADRRTLVADTASGQLVLPDFVAICPTLDDFDAFMHQEVGDHPPVRIRYIKVPFKPILEQLEAEHRRLSGERRASARALREQPQRPPYPTAGP
jgi:hypothetical protein